MAHQHDGRADHGLLANLIHDMPFIGMALVSPGSGQWLQVNDHLCEILGRTREELLATTWNELTHPADLTAERAQFERILAGASDGYSLEKRFLLKDGGTVETGVSVKCARSASHGVDHVVMTVRDITERKRTEEVLAAKEERLRLALLAGGMATWDWDVPSGEVVWNDAHFRMLGYEPGAVRPSYQSWVERLHPEDRPATEERLRRCMAEGGDYMAEFRVLWPDGTVRWIEARGQFDRDPEGRPVRCYGVMLDITEHKLAQEELFVTQQRLQAVMQAVPVGIAFSQDTDCRQVLGNPALLALFESRPEDNLSASAEDTGAIGRRVRYFDKGRELQYTDLPLQRAVAEQCAIPPTELEIELPNARRWFAEVSGAPLIDQHGGVIGGVAVVVDVTERKRAVEALREADRRKDEFLAMLAHELRNPLAPIRNAVHVLGRLQLEDPRVLWARELIEGQVAHLARLVDDLLDVSRIVRGKIALKRETVELAALVRQAVETARPYIEAKRHRLEVHLPDEPIRLEVDPVRLTQVLVNLLDNAAKYTPDGGRIELAARREGENLVIEVRDNGVGMPPELLPLVFDLFQQGERTLERPQGGLGIGLTLVQRLVELHGGRVEAASAGPGLGSVFTVRLPVPHETTRAAPSRERQIDRAGHSVRVLVVDDEPAVAESTAIFLRLEGHEVRTADSGEAALTRVAEFRPGVVLLDIGLPGQDGYEVARRIRQLAGGSEIKLVAVSGYGHDEAMRRCREAGFDQHMVKPVDPAELCALISHARH